MNSLPAVTDNISELLVKIISFTQTRERLLTDNINNARTSGFVPKDVAVEEFSSVMNVALISKRRLVLHDTENIKFGRAGGFQVRPFTDDSAKRLMHENPDEYIEEQLSRLMENRLNQRIATELLRKKEKAVSIFG
jgi:flagellar basal body rod protein FlgB